MKRFFGSLIATILAFTAGLVTASSWSSENKLVEHIIVDAAPPCPQNVPQPPAPVLSYSATPPGAFDFGQNGLRLVPERVKLDSNTLGYDIDVSYPQILSTPALETTNIRKVNQQLKDTATKLYQWPMSREEQVSYSHGKGIRNTVNFTYQVGLATDSFLAIHFIGYSFNSQSTQRQDSFAVNYDLTSGRPLKLSELFKPGSDYMAFISRYSRDALFKQAVNPEALEPSSGNFDVWQITTQGLAFNFAACKVANCSEGEMIVEIPYSNLKSILNADVPGKFNITYP
jgi:Protein of unknown function (DUF3298)